ncbi:hypothetical protein IAD21_06014 [Abditibacteriota bacterium]|nr:hypothetical protein IAD21_06014 [Abditibacteriota bacterium]
MQDDYLSATQVTQLKGVSRNAVYKAIQEGRLAAILIADHVAIPREAALAWTPKARTGRRQGIQATEETKAKMATSQRKRWQQRKVQMSETDSPPIIRPQAEPPSLP